jgi:hypothetical protein
MAFNITTGAKYFSVSTGNFVLELSYQGIAGGIEPHEGADYKVNVHIVVNACIGRFSLKLPPLTTIVRRDAFVANGLGITDLTPKAAGASGLVPMCEGSFTGVTDITYTLSSKAPLKDFITVVYDDLGGVQFTSFIEMKVRAFVPDQPAQGRVAFLRNFFGPIDQICTADVNGQNLNHFPNDLGWILSKPILSPTGGLLAYVALTDSMWGRSKLYVMNTDGTGNRLLVDQAGGSVGWPCWAPDGSFVAFTLQTGAKLEICTVKPDGTGFTRVLSKDGMNFSQPVLLQRDVWACLKSARGNTLIDQSIVMGSVTPGPRRAGVHGQGGFEACGPQCLHV